MSEKKKEEYKYVTDDVWNKLCVRKNHMKDTACTRQDCVNFVDEALITSERNHCRALSICENNGADCAFYKSN